VDQWWSPLDDEWLITVAYDTYLGLWSATVGCDMAVDGARWRSSERFGVNTSRLGLRLGGVTGNSHGAWSRRSVRRERERFEGVKAQREVGHASTSRKSRSGHAEMDGLCSLGLKTTMEAYFPVQASKPGADSVRPSVQDGGHVASSRSLLRGEGKSWRWRVRLMLREKSGPFRPFVGSYLRNILVVV
jgi:hypothetical protein